MCGVVAIYAYHKAALNVDRVELRRIRDHMGTRGPDGMGEWFSGDGRVALGHRRLSIIDLSDRGSQPMVSADGRYVISFNGEIYNYRELRSKLEARGHSFRSNSDTEVLLKLFSEYGENMFSQLRGMYAFSLWDNQKESLLLARDPYGIKPLYYADDGWTLRVASQVKALHAGGKVSRICEPAGIVGFYLLGSVPEPYTIYQEIRTVPAGTYIRVTNTGPGTVKQYFSISDVLRIASTESTNTNTGDKAGEVRSAVLESVGQHLNADVPVGAFLSAGIDSSALVALAAEIREKEKASVKDDFPINTVTLTFEEYRNTRNDEAPLAEAVAKTYGTSHFNRIVTKSEFIGDFPAFNEAMDQPTIDGTNTWFVSKAAREAGLKVAISGLGGDELFAGYPSFRDVPAWQRKVLLPGRVPGLGVAFRGAVVGLRKFFPKINPKFTGILQYGSSYPGAWFVRRGLFMPWELKEFLDKDMVVTGLQRLQLMKLLRRSIRPDPGTGMGRVAALEAAQYMRNQLLRDTDWTSMAHSLEVRTPLVDSVLLKVLAPAMFNRPATWSKGLLARTPARSLPANVINRAKTGFTVPVANWMESGGDLDIWKRVPSLRSRECHWSRRWAYTIGQLATADSCQNLGSM